MFKGKVPQRSDPWHIFSAKTKAPQQTSSAERILDEAQSLGALSDGQVAALFDVLTIAPGDQHVLALIDTALRPFRLRSVVNPAPWRPYPGGETQLDAGEIEIGVIDETGLVWRLPISDLPFIAIVGTTGSGKTSLVFGILESLA